MVGLNQLMSRVGYVYSNTIKGHPILNPVNRWLGCLESILFIGLGPFSSKVDICDHVTHCRMIASAKLY